MGIVDRVREAMPDAQITTDIIVGFPGETEEDFQQTLDILGHARFAGAYTFEYSPRPGTPAALMEQIPADVMRERYTRLHDMQESITLEEMGKFVGRDVEVLISGTGRKDSSTHRVTGRERTGTLVHIGVPEGEQMPQVGDFVTCTVTGSARHYIMSDPDVRSGHTYSVRR